MLKVKSSTGVVHYANLCYSDGTKTYYSTLCSHKDYFRDFDGYEHNWPKTDKSVTCKRCLKTKLLSELKEKDTKFRTRIIYYDIHKGMESSPGYPEGDLVRTLISQGYINKIPKKGEQIEITIY